MRQAVTTTIWIVSMALVLSGTSRADGADVAATISRARRLIQANDHSSAVAFLEEALPEAQAKDRSTIVELLRQSYEVMARQADASGRSRDAAYYRDNLAILNRPRESPSPAKKPAELPKARAEPSKTPAQPKPMPKAGGAPDGVANEPGRSPPIKTLLPDLSSRSDQPIKPEPAPLPEPLDPPTEKPPSPQRSSSDTTAGSGASGPTKSESDREANASTGVNLPAAAISPSTDSQHGPDANAGGQADSSNRSLEEADRLFAAKRYDEAGKSYAALVRQDRLPANRKEHWAYCRWVDVVHRINARPESAREWEELESEIQSIQQLTPKSWYGEYLRNKVAETRRLNPRLAAQVANLVARGSAPDEAETRKLPRPFAKDGADADSVAPKPAGRMPRALDTNVRRAGDESPAPGSWQVHETANFKIFHRDARLAEAAAEAAESVRATQAKRWSSPAAQRTWAPSCEIYLYPTGEMLAQATGQPSTSPGFSAMEVNGTRIVARKIHLRADHAQMRDAILPHEVTHVVVADLFITQPVPRWADEGIAVLAEPSTEQQLKASDLRDPLDSGRIFPLDKLMAMDYPDAKDWPLYYAQSVSLTRFLAEQGPPESLVRFVRACQQKGVEVALRDVYQIGGIEMLQQRWLEYARRQVATLGTSTADANTSP